MKVTGRFAFCIALLCSRLCCLSQDASDDAKRSVLDSIMDKENDALYQWSQGKISTWIGLHAKDATHVHPFSTKPAEGESAITELYGPIQTNTDPENCVPRNINFKYFGSSALLNYILEYPDATWQASESYVRNSGQWKIAHSHWSLILQSKSKQTFFMDWRIYAIAFGFLVIGFLTGKLIGN